eukprot:NODE_360_length_2356_cov_38.687304_g336_i0.p2 GENE.NODE_360_length_2356_cov_38.687304_g336_i0~~NODE_360_length_2356_cov_38.687304_g336_i0.p2  ORF type:complete len:126 (-),score=2.92 NODE_360_length_2356_cov_38.687304_g336_i0:439-816(-)
MSFPNPIIDLTDGSTDHDYEVLERKDRKVILKDISTDFSTPAYMSIAHTNTGKGVKLTQNSVVRLDRTVVNATTLEEGVISFYTVCRYPVKVATAAQVQEVGAQLADFLNTSGYLAKFVNQELPE